MAEPVIKNMKIKQDYETRKQDYGTMSNTMKKQDYETTLSFRGVKHGRLMRILQRL